jgi:DNA-directed RNA polymerase specialized sigma24 family protein
MTRVGLFVSGRASTGAPTWKGARRRNSGTGLLMSNAKPKLATATPATPEQVRDAFEALTTAELARLFKYCRWRLRALGSRQVGRDADEFLSDALISVLERRRAWFPEKIPFFVFFKGVVKSQTFNLRKKAAEDAFDDLKSLHRKDDPEGYEPLDELESGALDPERELEAQEIEREWREVEGLIQERFSDDPEAALMLEARLDGKTPIEIRAALGLTQQEYETTLKRVRRAVDKIRKGGRQ